MDVDGLLQTLTPEEFAAWRAFLRQREIESEQRFAVLLAAIHNAGWLAFAARGRGVDEDKFKEANDFLGDDARIETSRSRSRVLSDQESERRAAALYSRRALQPPLNPNP